MKKKNLFYLFILFILNKYFNIKTYIIYIYAYLFHLFLILDSFLIEFTYFYIY